MAQNESHKQKDILWAPWRIEYIKNCDRPANCIFCHYPTQDNDQQNLIVYRGAHTFVIMNRYPYNNGHVMIVPYRHTCELQSFTSEEQLECMQLLSLTQAVLKQTMNPHGFNIGMNLGRVAGAGIADHLHFHIVPRWDGDTNFMPVLGHAKVVSEGLTETWAKLVRGFESITTQ